MKDYLLSRNKLVEYANNSTVGIDANDIMRFPCEKVVEPCEDAISRQAVLNLIEHYNSDGLGSVFYGYDEGVKFANAVNKLPSVRPQTKIGHWIKGNYHIRCSECGEDYPYRLRNYCPSCGAKMQEDKE